MRPSIPEPWLVAIPILLKRTMHIFLMTGVHLCYFRVTRLDMVSVVLLFIRPLLRGYERLRLRRLHLLFLNRRDCNVRA